MAVVANYPELVKQEEERFDEITDLLLALFLAGGTAAAVMLYRRLMQKTSQLEEIILAIAVGTLTDLSPAQIVLLKLYISTTFRSSFTASVSRLANSFKRGNIPIYLGIRTRSIQQATKSTRQSSRAPQQPLTPKKPPGGSNTQQVDPEIRLQLQKALRAGFVLSGDGTRLKRFEPVYFVSLVLHSAAGEARKRAAMENAVAENLDLVQVSPQPSTVGDYCDLYRGRVFSISGSDPVFPPLTDCPNGGAPLHPWCHHHLKPVAADSPEAEAAAAMPPIPPEYIDLARRNATPGEYMKLWRPSKGKSNAG